MTSSGALYCSAKLADTAASRAFTSDCDDGFVLLKKISATFPDGNRLNVQVYFRPLHSNANVVLARRFSGGCARS